MTDGQSESPTPRPRRMSGLKNRSSMLFSRSGRNSQSGDRPTESRAGYVAPMLSVVEHVDTTLASDDSISKFMTTSGSSDSSRTPYAATPGTENGTGSMINRAGVFAAVPPKSGIYAKYEEMVDSVQSKLINEMQEREALLAKFEALNKDYDAQNRQLLTATEQTRKYQDELRSLQDSRTQSKQNASAVPFAIDEQPKTDEFFRGEIQKLMANVHNWVWAHFRDAKLDISKASAEESALLHDLLPHGAKAADAPKLPLLQAVTMSPIVKLLQDPFFVALPSSYSSLVEAHDLMKKIAPGSLLGKWRATTIATLEGSSDPSITKSTKDLISHVSKQVAEVLLSLTSSADQSELLPELEAIVAAAISLARQFRAQTAFFSFALPEKTSGSFIAFDKSLMETGANGEAAASTKVQLVLSPVVLKSEDEGAAKKVVIAKARVACEAP